MSLLARIVDAKRREVEALAAAARRRLDRRPLDVPRALRREGGPLRLIAEVKLRSPSAGMLSRALAPDVRALAYARAGTAMVSVLCDAPFFDGGWEHLAAARSAIDSAGLAVPLLAKEFVIDPRQIAEARDRGADAILLIARIVDGSRLAELTSAARGEGLEPFVEVVDETELDAALAAGARVVGVNARDLDTLQMDPARVARVLERIPGDCIAVHLSGVRSAEAVAAIARGRADAALIGEALMRADDPGPLLASMLEAAAAAAGN
jgi:indole-3-glycerol phosphate synthase